jgi:hypothetical protein
MGQRVKKGDVLLCYLTGVTRWVGAPEVLGPSTISGALGQLQAQQIDLDIAFVQVDHGSDVERARAKDTRWFDLMSCAAGSGCSPGAWLPADIARRKTFHPPSGFDLRVRGLVGRVSDLAAERLRVGVVSGDAARQSRSRHSCNLGNKSLHSSD